MDAPYSSKLHLCYLGVISILFLSSWFFQQSGDQVFRERLVFVDNDGADLMRLGKLDEDRHGVSVLNADGTESCFLGSVAGLWSGWNVHDATSSSSASCYVYESGRAQLELTDEAGETTIALSVVPRNKEARGTLRTPLGNNIDFVVTDDGRGRISIGLRGLGKTVLTIDEQGKTIMQRYDSDDQLDMELLFGFGAKLMVRAAGGESRRIF